MNVPTLTEDQIDFTIHCMAEWMRIKNNVKGLCQSSADVEHSALLRRLLHGKQALENPPPLRFSQPDYDLAEGEEVEVLDLWTTADGCEVSINQHQKWTWHNRNENILKYVPTGDLYQLRYEERQRVTIREPETYVAKLLKKIG